jgi:hypothetical protein
MTEPTAPQGPNTIRVRPEHGPVIRELTLKLSAAIGQRLSQPDALYLAARYALANLEGVAEFERERQ